MLKTYQREKLINAMIYFASNTQFVGKIKMFKLLYLMDFEHFRQTGKSVTGLEYAAWKFGPVPTTLMEEWEELEPDMARAISIVPEKVFDYVIQTAVPLAAFDEDYFSRRELDIMQGFAELYRETRSHTMIDVTHAQNGAWSNIWHGGEGQNETIPYELALPSDDPNRSELQRVAREHRLIVSSRLN